MTTTTYAISLQDARMEYESNTKFRKIIQSGFFVYIESSYILDTSDYVFRDEKTVPKLTDYAQKNLDECALSFDSKIIYKYTGSSTRGDSQNDLAVEKKHKIYYDPVKQKKSLTQDILDRRKAAIQQFEKQSKYQKNCWQRIYEILRENKANPISFEIKTGLHRDYFSRAKTGKDSSPDVRTIVAIAAGYNLGLHVAEELMGLAGHKFKPKSKEHDAYIFILTSMYDCSMDLKNELLEREGLKMLGTHFKD